MSVLIFIVILLILILVHELGHFVVAKWTGMRVDEFGIGFPPRALTITKKGDTVYTLNWLPFGGFVRIFGEDPDESTESGPDSERSFTHRPKTARAAVIVAGVLFNVLLAWSLFSAMFVIGTDVAITQAERPYARNIRLVVSYVLPDSPADKAGLVPGDTITAMESGDDRLDVVEADEAVLFIAEHGTEPITIHVSEDETITTYTLVPEPGLLSDEPERPVLGISMGNVGFLQYTNPFKALGEGALFTWDMTRYIWSGLSDFFNDIVHFRANFEEVAGPVGIVPFVGEAAHAGIASLIFLTALISVNLAIINILPIPALDGGRLLFLIIEAVKGSPVPPRIANNIHLAFFGLLILLIVVVTYFDVMRLLGS